MYTMATLQTLKKRSKSEITRVKVFLMTTLRAIYDFSLNIKLQK